MIVSHGNTKFSLNLQKRRLDIGGLVSSSSGRDEGLSRGMMQFQRNDNLYGDLPPEQHGHGGSHHSMFSSLLSSKLGLPLPNPAPEVSVDMVRLLGGIFFSFFLYCFDYFVF